MARLEKKRRARAIQSARRMLVHAAGCVVCSVYTKNITLCDAILHAGANGAALRLPRSLRK